VLGDRVVVLSARPGRIRKIFTINLPRPRQIESYAVVDLAREIMTVMKEDVLASTRDTEVSLLQEMEAQRVGDDVL
jgi:ABC-type nitrate/sulfonate/bicarbonate transport system ATPase subunit